MRTCAACHKPLTRRKKECCPECGVPLYWPDAGTELARQGQTLTLPEQAASESLIAFIEDYISERDNITCKFDYPGRHEQLRCAYQLMVRGRKFLARQRKDEIPDLTSHEFTTGLIKYMIESEVWWQENVESLRMFLGKKVDLTSYANAYYRSLREQYIRQSAEKESDKSLRGYFEGEAAWTLPGLVQVST